MKLPGLIDVHVHMRDPGATHKEDWDTGTAAALAGGITMVLGMPNTRPSVIDAETLTLALTSAYAKARCDYGQYVGATADNAQAVASLAPQAAGLKMYLDHTFGSLRLDDLTSWMAHCEHWPKHLPIAVHAEGRTAGAVMLMGMLADRPIHVCHVARRDEILMIRKAKEKGLKVTCEVAPHHLFLTKDDASWIGEGRSRVCPSLETMADQQALWDNLDVIDCFATDHAPHTLEEKDGPNPPPGFAGLEAMLPLLLTAVHEGRLTLEDVVTRLYDNPRRLFGLPTQPETWVEVDPDATYELRAADMQSRCGWTPFEGWKVRGRVTRVVLRGEDAFADGRVLAPPGLGRDVRAEG